MLPEGSRKFSRRVLPDARIVYCQDVNALQTFSPVGFLKETNL
jgi:hypothetical protein